MERCRLDITLSSQLTALRTASTEIQELITSNLEDAHHQLVMDLETSISCCKLLVERVKSFFSDLAQLTERPLDFRNRFKVVFGSAGPDGVQRLIEHQISALTLLLTGFNCKTMSEQQQHLKRRKTRKTLRKAQADSISLCVQRDTSSFSSQWTGNLSKIYRVFEFDSNVFSTKVYERAFRGSVKQLLRQQQGLAQSHKPGTRDYIYLLGRDEIGKDRIANTIHDSYPQACTEKKWLAHQLRMQNLCIDLMCTIIKRGTADWDTAQTSILHAYATGDDKGRPEFSVALDACAMLWWSSWRITHEPDPDPQGYLRETIEFKGIILHVDIIPAGDLNLYCGNEQARFFLYQMERVLPIRTVEPRYAERLPSDNLRARPWPGSDCTFGTKIASGPRVLIQAAQSWPTSANLHKSLSLNYVFDLCDYSNGAFGVCHELQRRLELCLAETASLAKRGPPDDLFFLLILTNPTGLEKQLATRSYLLTEDRSTKDPGDVILHIVARFTDVVQLPMDAVVFVREDAEKTDILFEAFDQVGLATNTN